MKHLVFYDAECPLCSNVKAVLQKLDWFHRIDWMPVQEIERSERYRFLKNRDIYDRIHMISSRGYLYEGFYTIRKLLKALPLTFPIGLAAHLPFMDQIFSPLYMWISKNRYHWFGRKQQMTV